MRTRRPIKKTTLSFFDYKWKRAPTWAKDTEETYRQWYLERYGYGTLSGLKRFLADKQNILEAGCGLARDSKMFAELNPNANIVAMDQSSSAIATARRTLKHFNNCRVLREDITNFQQYNGSFDFISCDQVIHHTPSVQKTLKHLMRKLKRGGILNFSVCRKKNKYRDLVDDLIMKWAVTKSPKEVWQFAEIVTKWGKALYELGIDGVRFDNKRYQNLQRFIHNNVFRCWYNPTIKFALSVSSNYDWFSGNPRFNRKEIRTILKKLLPHKILRFHEDDATISVVLKKL